MNTSRMLHLSAAAAAFFLLGIHREVPAQSVPCSVHCTCGCNANGGTECPCRGIKPEPHNFGLMQEKLNGAEKVYLNGQETTPREAIQAIENRVPEAAKKPRVVIIDQDAARRKQVRDELTRLPECADCVVQAYPPDHWHLLDLKTRQSGFFTGGAPTIYLLASDGKVLHRQDDYQGGAAAAAEAFRRARPDYDPRRDPDRRKPDPQPQPVPLSPGAIPQWALLAVLGVAAFLLHHRRQS